MRVTDLLNVEHGVFLAQLEELERRLDEGAAEPLLAALVATIGRAVAIHRGVEEEFLFPALQRESPGGCPPLRVMHHEHQLIEEAIETARGGRIAPHEARTFVAVLRDHIAKEMGVLFPLAERVLDAASLKEMARAAVDRIHERARTQEDR